MSFDKDALIRKRKNEEFLKKQGALIEDYLPAIEGEKKAKIKNPVEIARRAMALILCSTKAEGLSSTEAIKIMQMFHLEKDLTTAERTFLFSNSVTDEERTRFAWRHEAAFVLLWAIGYIKDLPMPKEICNGAQLVAIMVEKGEELFVVDATLLAISEILDQADLNYRMHYLVQCALQRAKQSPLGLNSSVVIERQLAFNWLSSYENKSWEDLSLEN